MPLIPASLRHSDKVMARRSVRKLQVFGLVWKPQDFVPIKRVQSSEGLRLVKRTPLGDEVLREYADELPSSTGSDAPEARWVFSDGLLGLLAHIAEHAYCEARCRDGHEWPKPQAPGRHPRPAACPSC